MFGAESAASVVHSKPPASCCAARLGFQLLLRQHRRARGPIRGSVAAKAAARHAALLGVLKMAPQVDQGDGVNRQASVFELLEVGQEGYRGGCGGHGHAPGKRLRGAVAGSK